MTKMCCLLAFLVVLKIDGGGVRLGKGVLTMLSCVVSPSLIKITISKQHCTT